MATLLDIRRNVATDSGHHELVTDFAGADYTDNGMDRHIQAAQRFIDRFVEIPGERQRYITNIATGQHLVTVPDIRFANRFFVDDGTSRYQLEQKTLDWMQENYKKVYTEITGGRPLYWAQNIMGDSSGVGLSNGDLTTSPTLYDTNLDLTSTEINNNPNTWLGVGTSTFTYNAVTDSLAYSQTFTDGGSEYPPLLIQSLGSSFAGTATIAVDATITTGDIFAGVMVYNGSTFTVDVFGALEDSGTLFLSPTKPWNMIFVVCREDGRTTPLSGPNTAGTATGTINSVTVAGGSGDYLLLPPADQSYTLEVTGGFYAKTLVNDTDISWWSDKHPEILEDATRLSIERRLHRNTQGVNDFTAPLIADLMQIYHDVISEQTGMPADEAVING